MSWSVKRMQDHQRATHSPDAGRKQTCELVLPKLDSLPEMPATLPAYMAVSRHIRQTPISAVRHAKIGPWVRNLVGFDTF
jgi:hypothetical protein